MTLECYPSSRHPKIEAFCRWSHPREINETPCARIHGWRLLSAFQKLAPRRDWASRNGLLWNSIDCSFSSIGLKDTAQLLKICAAIPGIAKTSTPFCFGSRVVQIVPTPGSGQCGNKYGLGTFFYPLSILENPRKTCTDHQQENTTGPPKAKNLNWVTTSPLMDMKAATNKGIWGVKEVEHEFNTFGMLGD